MKNKLRRKLDIPSILDIKQKIKNIDWSLMVNAIIIGELKEDLKVRQHNEKVYKVCIEKLKKQIKVLKQRSDK